MPRKYPPLTPSDVRGILKAAGFTHARTESSHETWEHPEVDGAPRLVTVDAAISEFDKSLLKTMIGQSGLSHEDFYCQTPSTAKKINKRVLKRASN